MEPKAPRSGNGPVTITGPPGRLQPLWIQTAESTSYPGLDGASQVDVAVIGGGIAGLTTALLIQQAGHRVALVEADRIALGASARSTVKVTAGHALKYSELEAMHGEDASGLYARSNQSAVERVAKLIEDLAIDCDFQWRRNLVCAETDDEREAVRAEVEAERRARLPASFVEETDLPFPVKGSLVLERQAQFHPRRYLLGLASAFVDAGGAVYEQTRALDVDAGEPCVVTTERGELRAEQVVIASQFPIANRGLLFAKMAPMQEYAVAGPIDAARAPADMYISAGSGGWSLRTFDEGADRLLIVVGQKHKVGEGGDEEARYQSLTAWAAERFGMTEVRYRWTTHDLWPIDRLPYIGRIGRGNPPVFVGTGFGGWGMTNGTVAGMILSDLISGVSNDWAELYDPIRRDITAGAGQFLRENLKVAARWIGDRVAGETRELDDLGRDQAAIVVQDGGEHVAAYRDADGKLHAVSASCTHLGCLVRWNTAERTWDCPCHGSRFGPDGAVIAAPAVHPLPPRQIEFPGG